MGLQRLVWVEGTRYTGIDGNGHEVDLDATSDGLGVKPADLLPISLASCIAYTIVDVLLKQRQDLRAFEATIESERDPDPPWRFRAIAVRFVARGHVDIQKARKALTLADEKYCSISATLRPTVELVFDIAVEPAQASRSTSA